MTEQQGETIEQAIPEYGWSTKPEAGVARELLPRIREILRREGIQSGARLLDIGCGNGFVGGNLSNDWYDVTGLDPSAEGIEIARGKFPNARWEQMLAEEDVLERLHAEPFDVVISTEVVEHVYTPLAWARACRSALRAKGLFVCSTPYHGYLKNLLISVRGGWDKHADPLWDGGHIKLWSVATLTRLFDLAGFERISWEGVGRMPMLWKSMLMHGRRPADGA